MEGVGFPLRIQNAQLSILHSSSDAWEQVFAIAFPEPPGRHPTGINLVSSESYRLHNPYITSCTRPSPEHIIIAVYC